MQAEFGKVGKVMHETRLAMNSLSLKLGVGFKKISYALVSYFCTFEFSKTESFYVLFFS